MSDNQIRNLIMHALDYPSHYVPESETATADQAEVDGIILWQAMAVLAALKKKGIIP